MRGVSAIVVFALLLSVVGCTAPSYQGTQSDSAAPESLAPAEPMERTPIIAAGAPELWVDRVTGAPGDGNDTLTMEIERLMKQAGLDFARTPSEADYFVTAVVNVFAVDVQTEIVEIIWRVTDRFGTEIGRIRQENGVRRGSLHENWGETAFFAAQGGLEGVLAILESLGHARP